MGGGLVVLVLIALQMGAFGRLRLLGVYPEVLVVVACCVGLHRGPVAGAVFGFILGFLMDVPGGHLVGLSGLGYAAAGLFAGLLGLRAFPERWSVTASAVALGTVASQAVYAAGASAFGFSLPFWEAGPRIIGALLVYHLLLTPLVYPLTRQLADWLMPRGLEA
ncbi:MAG: rod shape-determining protein MreD [Bacillota bacterium]|jgi:rod shape-determining protein MreD|nr:MAG: rod shape-determining protein MreD [Bacillota bacterium]